MIKKCYYILFLLEYDFLEDSYLLTLQTLSFSTMLWVFI